MLSVFVSSLFVLIRRNKIVLKYVDDIFVFVNLHVYQGWAILILFKTGSSLIFENAFVQGVSM